MKRQADSEAQAAIETINEQITGHQHFKKIAQRLQSEAGQLKTEASKLPERKSKFSLFAIFSFVGAFVLPLAFFLLMTLVTALLKLKSTPFTAICCLPFFFFLVLIAVGAFFQVSASRLAKKIKDLQDKASEMESSEGWKKYANAEEKRFIDELFRWRTGQLNQIEQKRAARHQEIDKWLEESTEALT
jgi:hypothetical protein